jgi:ABC-type uncharacterized transport system ATPase subunit
MEAIKQKPKNITNYRKDFTPEERALYNAYVVTRMKIYYKTDKGKESAERNTKIFLEKKKLQNEANNQMIKTA